jgi:hypothetical protein
LPRLAIDSYWRAHPIRADRLARALAARVDPLFGPIRLFFPGNREIFQEKQGGD